MSITGPSFISIQVRDLARSAAFYESVVGLRRAAVSPPHAVVFDTSPIAFAIRDAEPGTDLTAQPLGVGVALWFHDADAAALHESLVAAGVTIAKEPITGPFGFTFAFADPDGYAVTVHDRLAPA
jgi:predicted enzyme related to lactoylglutathione lyase